MNPKLIFPVYNHGDVFLVDIFNNSFMVGMVLFFFFAGMVGMVLADELNGLVKHVALFLESDLLKVTSQTKTIESSHLIA